MEKVVFVKDDCLKEINDLLSDGWRVKDFKPVAECVSQGENICNELIGNIYAYFVLYKGDRY